MAVDRLHFDQSVLILMPVNNGKQRPLATPKISWVKYSISIFPLKGIMPAAMPEAIKL